VSRVLSGRSRQYRISREREDQIRGAAKRLGYRRNELGRALREGRNCDIGLLMGGEMDNWLPARLLAGIQAGLTSADYPLRIAHHDLSGPRIARDWGDLVRQDMVDGVLVAVRRGAPGEPALRRTLAAWGRPAVWLSHPLAPHAVRVETEADAGRATRILLEMGHRAILFLGIADPTGPERRQCGYEQAMRLAGLPPSVLIEPSSGQMQAALAARLRADDRPTAILSHNDQQAISAMIATAAAGLAVPNDLSILSLSARAGWATDAIARFTFDERDRGLAAVDLLSRLIRQPDTAIDPPTMNSTLHRGQTLSSR
jgi:LacI family transcriptional regulator